MIELGQYQILLIVMNDLSIEDGHLHSCTMDLMGLQLK
jgi:hypothetical protein